MSLRSFNFYQLIYIVNFPLVSAFSAQLVGAIEYTDCITAEGCDPLSKKCPGYNIKLHLIVRFQSYIFGECEITFCCHYY